MVHGSVANLAKAVFSNAPKNVFFIFTLD